MKIKKYDLIPLLLFIYTIVMAVWGWNQFDGNRWEFIGMLAANILVIVLLRFVLKRRERYRKEMKERNNKILSQQENTPKDQSSPKIKQLRPNLKNRFGRSCLIQKRFIHRERFKVKQVISGSIPMRMGIQT